VCTRLVRPVLIRGEGVVPAVGVWVAALSARPCVARNRAAPATVAPFAEGWRRAFRRALTRRGKASARPRPPLSPESAGAAGLRGPLPAPRRLERAAGRARTRAADGTERGGTDRATLSTLPPPSSSHPLHPSGFQPSLFTLGRPRPRPRRHWRLRRHARPRPHRRPAAAGRADDPHGAGQGSRKVLCVGGLCLCARGLVRGRVRGGGGAGGGPGSGGGAGGAGGELEREGERGCAG